MAGGRLFMSDGSLNHLLTHVSFRVSFTASCESRRYTLGLLSRFSPYRPCSSLEKVLETKRDRECHLLADSEGAIFVLMLAFRITLGTAADGLIVALWPSR